MRLMLPDPFRDQSSVLSRGQRTLGPPASAEHELPRDAVSRREVVIDRVAGLLCQLEANRPTGLLLPDRSPIERVPVGRDLLDLERDDIATATRTVAGWRELVYL
jgi:hypothetical protein